MLKYAFLFLLIIHGLIHILGFAKAYEIAELEQLTKTISRPLGLLWLVSALMLMTAAVLFASKKKWWWLFGISAILLSQILIFLYWTDAKFGTLPNLLILVVCISAFGKQQFDQMVRLESLHLLENVDQQPLQAITMANIEHLPVVVQKWMVNSGVISKEPIRSVRLKQVGEMKTKPGGKWIRFKAQQYFDVINPAFIWHTEINMMPPLYLVGRDKLKNGTGEMLIKLLSVIPVVNEGKNEKMNSGTMIRFMAEMVWFPSAALNPYLQWQESGPTSAKVTMTYKDVKVSGEYQFNDTGEMLSFRAKRYFGGDKEAQPQDWIVEALEFKTFEGYKIPHKNTVTWKLPEGDFTWLKLEITDWNTE